MEVLVLFKDALLLPVAINFIPMSFGWIHNIKHLGNEMLACCKIKCSVTGNMVNLGEKGKH